MSYRKGSIEENLYARWDSMHQRVKNKRHPKFPRYGGRGITICAEWSKFRPFFDWATQNGWAKGLLLDRRDNDGNYTPENCRFVTPKVSANNRDHFTPKRQAMHIALGQSSIRRPVIRSDGKRFDSITKAAKTTRAKIGTIWAAIRFGRRCAGFKFEYL